jgi:F-type H+-transporting ATPase subunit delta
MSSQNSHSPTAVAYAQALLDLANERGHAKPIQEELEGLAQVLKANPPFRLYLADPAIGTMERRQTLDRIFRGRISNLVLNFLGVVNEHGRLKLLGRMIDAYEDLLQAQLGLVEVDVFAARKLASDELELIRKRVSAALKKEAVVHPYVDPSLIGGMILRVGDKLIDASVKSQLQAMKKRLVASPDQE